MRQIAVEGGTRRLRQERPFTRAALNASGRPEAQCWSQAIKRREWDGAQIFEFIEPADRVQ